MGIISSGNTVIDNGAIDANEVDTTQIANDAVTADKLADTAVVAGSYTSASITVDAQGRITSASSGSAGAGAFVPNVYSNGPASGTVTSNGSKLIAYATAGGGGGGGGSYTGNTYGGNGGTGMMAVFTKDITAPFSQPYAIGAGGNPGGGGFNSAGGGGTGGATSVATFFQVNGGNGGGGASPNNANPGNPGSVSSGTPLYSSTSTGTRVYTYPNSGGGGTRGNPGGFNNPGNPGSAGTVGSLFLFDNVGA